MIGKNYRSVVGSFMYLAMGTRPDLAYTLQQLSQFLHNPGPTHWSAVQRALRYLKGTRTYGIRLGGIASIDDFPFLSAYVDANYAMCVDTRRCISGFFTLFFGSPVSWLAKKQPLVTLSTTEAEFVALALCIQELLYLRQLASELQQTSDQPVLVDEDNQSTIKIATNAELHGRSKHIDVRYMFVRDLVDSGEFQLKWCSSGNQLADFFTKPLPAPAFADLRSRLYIHHLPYAFFADTHGSWWRVSAFCSVCEPCCPFKGVPIFRLVKSGGCQVVLFPRLCSRLLSSPISPKLYRLVYQL
ncbi:hypothetical protein AaE_015838 [Aphanomyces astaci]|uniref:Reverse transcriptase Ty1/copia-type domain-containing protein n=1 Tax=Aphanomyces astaci TaxID=112090 RepID=A0A6A4YVS9_APHAT|nr:hypothetical protein AaE_015838 [Aphanomyces astaci]